MHLFLTLLLLLIYASAGYMTLIVYVIHSESKNFFYTFQSSKTEYISIFLLWPFVSFYLCVIDVINMIKD